MQKLLAAFIFLIIAPIGKTQTVKTDNPAEKRLKEIISIINNYEVAKATDYIRENYATSFLNTNSLEEHRAFLSRVNDECKNLSVSSVDAQKQYEASALVQLGLTKAWRQLVVRTEPTPPNKVTMVTLKLATPPGTSQLPKPVSDEEASKELDAYIKKLEKENIFSGNVLVARNGKIIFHQAYGMASKEFHYPNSLSTRFIIGSINKMFTATSILQLAEQKKLSLDDKVFDVLPGVLADSIARKIRIRHLLTHTSGLGDFLFTEEMSRKSKEYFRTIADYLPGLKDDRLFFEPGTRWQYSNTGFLLLGAIIEKVSGLSYEDYVNKNIYQPAGMVNTFFPELDNVNEGLADTYEKDYLTGKPVFHNTRYYQVIRGTPAGGGFSNCIDLLNFLQALNSGKLLKAESVQLMESPKPEMNSPNYGFGMQIFDENSYGHTGGGPGTNAVVRTDRKKNLTVVILGNQNTGSSSVERTVFELF